MTTKSMFVVGTVARVVAMTAMVDVEKRRALFFHYSEITHREPQDQTDDDGTDTISDSNREGGVLRCRARRIDLAVFSWLT